MQLEGLMACDDLSGTIRGCILQQAWRHEAGCHIHQACCHLKTIACHLLEGAFTVKELLLQETSLHATDAWSHCKASHMTDNKLSIKLQAAAACNANLTLLGGLVSGTFEMSSGS